MALLKVLAVLLIAYLLGSLPTALWYSKLTYGADIRTLGDGNMGARNSKRQFGWRAGVLITLADILKGLLAVLLAEAVDLPDVWRYFAGTAAVIGHDFPIFAQFKGGQGFSTTTGVFLGLFPNLTLIGFFIYVVIYFFSRSSDLAAGLGMGFIFITTLIRGGSFFTLAFIVLILLFIPFKKWLDRGRISDIHGRMKPSM